MKPELASKSKPVLDERVGHHPQRAQPGQKCTEHRVFGNGWWLWKWAHSNCPSRETFSIRERAELGQLLSLRALGLVGGVPKLNPLIRSAQPGPASLAVGCSLVLPTVSAARQGAGEPHLPLVPCWHGLVEVKPCGTCVLVTCSSSMIYEGQLSNLCFSIYQLHCHLPMLVLERFQSSLCP